VLRPRPCPRCFCSMEVGIPGCVQEFSCWEIPPASPGLSGRKVPSCRYGSLLGGATPPWYMTEVVSYCQAAQQAGVRKDLRSDLIWVTVDEDPGGAGKIVPSKPLNTVRLNSPSVSCTACRSAMAAQQRITSRNADSP